MLKKPYTTPCWFMLLLAIFSVGMIIFHSHGYGHMGAMGLMTRPSRLIVPYLWPLLMFIEAIIYWRIRKTNVYHRESWLHVLLFFFAYLTPNIKEWIFELYDQGLTPHWELVKFIRTVTVIQVLAFWASLILAHVIFIQMLTRLRIQEQNKQDTNDTNNILDDITV